MRRLGHVLAMLLVLVVSMGVMRSDAEAAPGGTPWFGLLQPVAASAGAYQDAGVRRVTLELGWDAYEPRRGKVNADYVSEKRRELARYRSAGLEVALDLGFQYPPAWVFALPGQTRFVNQYGDVWSGGLSNDVPNAVFNTNVRAAQRDYLQQVGRDFGLDAFEAVRVGGLLSGELRYPPSRYQGHDASLWGFDPAALAASPVPGWRPGVGTVAQAERWAGFYLDSIARYERWLLGQVAAVFPRAERQVMLPGWGLRPGQVVTAARTDLLLTGLPGNDSLSEGSDWVRQLDVLAASPGGPVTAVVTWLDAPSFGTSLQTQPPVSYIAALAAARDVPVIGENTGGGGLDALTLCLERARQLGLDGVMWLSGRELALPEPDVSLRDIAVRIS